MNDGLLLSKEDDLELRLLLEAIYDRFQYDFRDYAKASLRRRLSQAMRHFQCKTLSQLQDRVLHEATVLPSLLNYLTVQVSELFRDPLYFKTLREQVIPYLRTYPSLKIWVAGCSAGEEVYSLAILLREEGLADRTLIYATDINHDALQKATAGVYDLDRMAQFTENHRQSGGKGSLSEYYTAAYGAAVMDKTLRDNAVFSDHSLVTDSVFAEVHLISCRNVLIYFEREAQERATRLFCDSLVRKGFLGLGSKESLRFLKTAEQFEEVSRTARIFQKKV